ncbi:MAG: 16S rRNA (cytosine(1402)-N(4))-methyltransferase RsmH [Halieaceae bacterium]|nr:16S rRNA (cytosine(1402)-N(4))-methyltransferase RsmH [Halieaceae bacterium]
MHESVLLEESLQGLVGPLSGRYVDGTFGRGGHTRALLALLNEDATVLVMDKDPQAIECAQVLAAEDARVSVYHGSFADLPDALCQLDWPGVDGILLDLGVSSPQLDQDERGFSFQRNGPLDMRMDNSSGQTVADYLQGVTEGDLVSVLREYGEERFARRIAGAIVQARTEKPITTTLGLAELVKAAHPRWEKHKHPATRTFQALRIAINRELEDLDALLSVVVGCLLPGGRLAVISFHSLEDRKVKQFMRQASQGPKVPRGVPVQGDIMKGPLALVGKAIKPSESEIRVNVRARSAVLRIAEHRR